MGAQCPGDDTPFTQCIARKPLITGTEVALEAFALQGRPSKGQGPTLDKITVDAIAREGFAKGRHSPAKEVALKTPCRLAVAPSDGLVPEREERRDPAAVATGGTEAGVVLLNEGD